MASERPESESPFGADFWVVLARYTSGESLPDETEAVRRWLAEDSRRAALLTELDERTRNAARSPDPKVDIDAAWRRVSARLDEPVRLHTSTGQGPHQARPRWNPAWLAAAAVITLVAGGLLLWRAVGNGGASTLAAQTYRSPVGVADSIRLPDGSRVVLGPGSVLMRLEGYGQRSRELELSGQALFDVQHDAARPFRVRAGTTVIEDLGTTFMVRSDSGEDIQVVVTVGAVAVRSDRIPSDTGVTLRAGDRGAVNATGRVVTARATGDDTAWTEGRLVFDNAPLIRVQSELRRWYGVELRIADATLLNRHLTASFSGEPLEQVLDVIRLALGANIERSGDTVVVRAAAGAAERR